MSFFPFVIISYAGFDSIFPWSLAPDNPTILLSSTYFSPFRILAPWLWWFKILWRVDSGDTWDWTSYAEQTPVTNERSLSDCAGPKAWSKVVLLFPRRGLPSLDLGGSNPSANTLYYLIIYWLMDYDYYSNDWFHEHLISMNYWEEFTKLILSLLQSHSPFELCRLDDIMVHWNL